MDKYSKPKIEISSNRRRRGIRTLAALMPKVTRKVLGRRGFAEANIITDWATIVGSNLAEICHPEKLTFPRGRRTDGVLHIRAIGGAATELQHLEPQVVERINQYFGYAAITRLKLTRIPPITPVATQNQPAIEKTMPQLEKSPLLPKQGFNKIKNSELRNALENLGKAIITRNHR